MKITEGVAVADTHMFSSATLPALIPSGCYSGTSWKTGTTQMTKISGVYQPASLASLTLTSNT